MSVSAGHGKLKEARRLLAARWAETRVLWHDEVRDQFETQYIAPLMSQLRAAEEAFELMGSVLGKVRRDCE
jgi:hypothetical protein